jgi:hypothetical protein
MDDNEKIVFSRKPDGRIDFDSRKLDRFNDLCQGLRPGTRVYAAPELIYGAGQEMWNCIKLRMAATGWAVDEALIFESSLNRGLHRMSQAFGTSSSRDMLAVLEDENHDAR